MYKKQMKFQKIVCYLTLIAGAIAFLYSLGLLTDLYDSLYSMMPEPTDPSLDRVAGARIFYDMQEFNRDFTKYSIGIILTGVFCFIMNTHTRRRYYVGNYVAIAASVIGNIAISVWGIIKIGAYRLQYLTEVDFEKLESQAKKRGVYYTDSTFWFDIRWYVFGLVLIVAALMVANLIWKIIVTKAEKKLIEEGKEAV